MHEIRSAVWESDSLQLRNGNSLSIVIRLEL